MAVDLAYRSSDSEYWLYELKVDSSAQSPLIAAMELLGYGVLFFAARSNADKFYKEGAVAPNMLSAQAIHLRVLCPKSLYKERTYPPRFLADLGAFLMRDLAHFCKNQLSSPKLTVDIDFEQFDDGAYASGRKRFDNCYRVEMGLVSVPRKKGDPLFCDYRKKLHLWLESWASPVAKGMLAAHPSPPFDMCDLG